MAVPIMVSSVPVAMVTVTLTSTMIVMTSVTSTILSVPPAGLSMVTGVWHPVFSAPITVPVPSTATPLLMEVGMALTIVLLVVLIPVRGAWLVRVGVVV